jgi:hypothetical protein
MTCWKVRGQSIGTTRMDESKMGTATLQWNIAVQTMI